jgi:hypothetical protein
MALQRCFCVLACPAAGTPAAVGLNRGSRTARKRVTVCLAVTCMQQRWFLNTYSKLSDSWTCAAAAAAAAASAAHVAYIGMQSQRCLFCVAMVNGVKARGIRLFLSPMGLTCIPLTS